MVISLSIKISYNGDNMKWLVFGAANLSVEEAANIQDTFADFIVERLNFRE